MKNIFFKLPFTFSEKLLVSNLQICDQYQYTPHFNTADYDGDWTSISLRSPSGEMDNIWAHSANTKAYKDTLLMEKCHYFKEVVDTFQCEKESVRLLKLAPHSKIKEHSDYNLSYEDGLFRIHVPILTNDRVYFYIQDKRVEMEVGSCWYGNFNLPHKVENQGDTDRIHLVIDCKRNAWSDELFKEMGYDFEEEHKPVEYTDETKLKMIEALEHLDTEASRSLLKQLRSELKAKR